MLCVLYVMCMYVCMYVGMYVCMAVYRSTSTTFLQGLLIDLLDNDIPELGKLCNISITRVQSNSVGQGQPELNGTTYTVAVNVLENDDAHGVFSVDATPLGEFLLYVVIVLQ